MSTVKRRFPWSLPHVVWGGYFLIVSIIGLELNDEVVFFVQVGGLDIVVARIAVLDLGQNRQVLAPGDFCNKLLQICIALIFRVKLPHISNIADRKATAAVKGMFQIFR